MFLICRSSSSMLSGGTENEVSCLFIINQSHIVLLSV
jgi:hypothetical protein